MAMESRIELDDNCRMANNPKKLGKGRPPTPPNPVMARAIADAQAKGYPQSRLAEEIGLNSSQLTKFKAGEREPYIMDLVRMSRALDVSVVSLILPYLNEDDVRRAGSSDISEPIQAALSNSVFQEFHKLAELVLELRNRQRGRLSSSDSED